MCGILRTMADDEEMDYLQEIDDPEVRDVVARPAELRQMVYEAMNQIVDSTAVQSARKMMTSPDVPDNIKRDVIFGWLAHRRQDRELMHKIASGKSDGISFTFNVGTNQEVDNVRQIKSAFGVGEAEDAEVTDE